MSTTYQDSKQALNGMVNLMQNALFRLVMLDSEMSLLIHFKSYSHFNVVKNYLTMNYLFCSVF